tara:strand:+ start:10073 stop:10618 length:546 start_codon:yes stop_codon:yes gene_type:complete
MLLSDVKILEMLNDKSLSIIPEVKNHNIRPNAVRVHLNTGLIKYKDQTVNPMLQQEIEYTEISIKDQPYTLMPGEFVLGATLESIKTPRDIVGVLDGRSTLARLGLMIHMTALTIDSLYDESRTITLEIYNASNMKIVLTSNMPIGSLGFMKLDQPVLQKTQGQYRHQNGVCGANLKNQFS